MKDKIATTRLFTSDGMNKIFKKIHRSKFFKLDMISAALLISLLTVTQFASNFSFITISRFYVYTSIYIYMCAFYQKGKTIVDFI